MFPKIVVLYEIYSKKLQCTTTFNSVFVGKKSHQNRTRVDFGIMFLKNVVLHEIYSKKSQ